LEDDLNTPAAVGAMDALASAIIAVAAAGRQVESAQAGLREMGQIFGLRLEAAGPEERVMAGWEEHLKHYSS
jgi:cysteinyl-tRNA synthetase